MNEQLIHLNSKRKKDSTVIILNRFSEKLMVFLSVESKNENILFTTQKELLWAMPEGQAEALKRVISEGEEFFVFTKNEKTGKKDRLSSRFLRFEVVKLQYQK